jgi:hypothetical protein
MHRAFFLKQKDESNSDRHSGLSEIARMAFVSWWQKNHVRDIARTGDRRFHGNPSSYHSHLHGFSENYTLRQQNLAQGFRKILGYLPCVCNAPGHFLKHALLTIQQDWPGNTLFECRPCTRKNEKAVFISEYGRLTQKATLFY